MTLYRSLFLLILLSSYALGCWEPPAPKTVKEVDAPEPRQVEETAGAPSLSPAKVREAYESIVLMREAVLSLPDNPDDPINPGNLCRDWEMKTGTLPQKCAEHFSIHKLMTLGLVMVLRKNGHIQCTEGLHTYFKNGAPGGLATFLLIAKIDIKCMEGAKIVASWDEFDITKIGKSQ